MGLDVTLYDGNIPVYEPSSKYPKHMFQKGYLRSSYNDYGYNSVLRALTSKDLYYIFGDCVQDLLHGDSQMGSVSKRALRDALGRAKEVLEELRTAPPFIVKRFPGPWPDRFEYTDDIVDAVVEEDAQIAQMMSKGLDGEEGGALYSRRGVFFYGPLPKVKAIVPFKEGFAVVCQESIDWYIQATEIVIEFIEKALSLEDPAICWSS